MSKKPIIKHHALSSWVIWYPLQNFKGTDSMLVIFSIQCGLFFFFALQHVPNLISVTIHIAQSERQFFSSSFFFLPPIWLNWFISYYEHILSLKCDPWCFKWIHYRINDVMWLSFNFRALAMWSGNLDGNMTLPFSQLWQKTLVSPGCLF